MNGSPPVIRFHLISHTSDRVAKTVIKQSLRKPFKCVVAHCHARYTVPTSREKNGHDQIDSNAFMGRDC